MSFLQNLVDQRAAAWERAKQIMDAAAAESRDLTAEEAANLDAINADLDAKDKRIAAVTAAERRAREADAARAALDAVARPEPAPVQSAEETALRAVIAGERRGFESRPTLSPTEVRDVTKGSTGAPVPTSFYDRIMVHLVQVGPMWDEATVIRTDGGEAMQFPRTTAHSTAAIISEGGTVTESDPTFGAMISLGAYKYGFSVQLSSELLADSGVDIVSYVADQAGIALAVATNTHFTTGTGSSQPRGIVTAATVGVTGGTGVTGAFTADNLIDLLYSVNATYRRQPGCQWQARDAALAAIRKLKDSQNRYLWEPAYQAGQPDRLLGFPILSNPDVPAPAISAKSVLFGVVPRYAIRVAGPIRFERSDEFAFQNDLVTFRALLRADGNLLDQTGAVKVFQGGAS